MEQATRNKEKLHFARVMVEVGLQQKLPDEISFCNEHGSVIEQKVEYEWRPILCTKCAAYGREGDDCRKAAGKLQWVKKKIQQYKDGFMLVGTQRKHAIVEEPVVLVHNPFLALQNDDEVVDTIETQVDEGDVKDYEVGNKISQIDVGGIRSTNGTNGTVVLGIEMQGGEWGPLLLMDRVLV